jgi:hypothetical protein
MPAMGSMAEMNDKATLTTTNTPGGITEGPSGAAAPGKHRSNTRGHKEPVKRPSRSMPNRLDGHLTNPFRVDSWFGHG